jgi:hypothetical protein
MAERGDVWLNRVVDVAGVTLGAAMTLLSVRTGGGQPRLPPPDEDDDDYNPLNEPDEVLPPVVEQAFARLGLQGSGVHERAEGLYAMYRVLKTLGYSDADIARLALQKAGSSVDEGLDRVRPSDARVAFEALEEAAVRAATEVDARFDLRGDLIRLVRDGAVAARSGREDLLMGLERGLQEGRGHLRRILQRLSRDEGDE